MPHLRLETLPEEGCRHPRQITFPVDHRQMPDPVAGNINCPEYDQNRASQLFGLNIKEA
jgi:hypothetical protein